MNCNIVKSGFPLTNNLKDFREYSKGFLDFNYHNETLLRTIKRKAAKNSQNINTFKAMKSIATMIYWI